MIMKRILFVEICTVIFLLIASVMFASITMNDPRCREGTDRSENEQLTRNFPLSRDNPFTTLTNWEAFDASNIGGQMTRGYFGAAFDGRYVYYVPCRTSTFHGIVLRYDTQGVFKDAASWESYDAGLTDGLDTVGFAGAVFDGRHVYFIPFSNATSRHACVLRYDTQADFSTAGSWSAYDAGFTGAMGTKGYNGAVFDGRYIYLTPFGYDPIAHGRVLRYDTQADFKTAGSWSVHDAAGTDGLDTRGYYGSAFDGRYVYFTGFHNGSEFHGRMLRYDTQGSFDSAASWDAYDANNTDGEVTIGYKGAIYDGRYIYYVPFRDGEFRHGRVLRYDTQGDFKTAGSWSAYDADNTDGLDTRGFVGAVKDDRYIYFIPYSGDNNQYHGRMLRYDTEGDFNTAGSWSGFDVSGIDGKACKGYKYGTSDGRYLYFAPYNNGATFSGIALRYDTTGGLDMTGPVADAGMNRTVGVGTHVTFDGSGSTDDVEVVNWTWTFDYNGSDVVLNGSGPSFQFDIAGNYTVHLNVSDMEGNWAADSIWINVVDVDTEAPVAAAGEDRIVERGTTVTLDGSGSTDNTGVVNWTWTFEHNGTEMTLRGESIIFIFYLPGNYLIMLKVTDLAGNWGLDHVWINITYEADTEKPMANAGSDQIVEKGSEVTLNGGASGDNVGIVNWTWEFTYNDTSFRLYGELVKFVFLLVGNYSVTLKVTDAAGNWHTDMLLVTVLESAVLDTVAPVAIPGPVRSVERGATFNFDGTASTDNVGVTNWTWTFIHNNTLIERYGPTPFFIFEIVGNYTITLEVMDAAGNVGTDVFYVTVTPPIITPDDDVPDDDDIDDDVPEDDDSDDDAGNETEKDESKGLMEKLPWLWIGVGAGALLLLILIIILVKRRGDDDWDDDDDEDEYDDFIETKSCLVCGEMLSPPDAKFCKKCGEDQDPFIGPVVSKEEKFCINCGVGLFPPDAQFCQNCGANQQAISENESPF